MESEVITVCNKLNRVHSQTGLDVWFKHTLENIQYSIERVTTVNGTQTSIGEVFNILIPFDSNYVPYTQWKDLVDRSKYFTMNQGDYIFLDVNLEEEVNPNSIINLKNKYKPRVCEVRSITEVPKRPGVQIQLRVSGV